MPTLSAASKKNLQGVHPDLIKVVERAIEITPVDFKITQGVRTVAEQKKLVAHGASQTMRSRHIPASNRSKMAEAVDIVALIDGKVRWDWPLYPRMAAAFKQASVELKIPIVWGGDWKSLKDGPHFELKNGVRYGY